MIMSSFLSMNLRTANMSIFRVLAVPVLYWVNSFREFFLDLSIVRWLTRPTQVWISISSTSFPSLAKQTSLFKILWDHIVSEFTSRHTTQRRKTGGSSSHLQGLRFQGSTPTSAFKDPLPGDWRNTCADFDDLPPATICESWRAKPGNMASPERESNFIPAIKCSHCGEAVSLALIGNHVCPAVSSGTISSKLQIECSLTGA